MVGWAYSNNQLTNLSTHLFGGCWSDEFRSALCTLTLSSRKHTRYTWCPASCGHTHTTPRNTCRDRCNTDRWPWGRRCCSPNLKKNQKNPTKYMITEHFPLTTKTTCLSTTNTTTMMTTKKKKKEEKEEGREKKKTEEERGRGEDS